MKRKAGNNTKQAPKTGKRRKDPTPQANQEGARATTKKERRQTETIGNSSRGYIVTSRISNGRTAETTAKTTTLYTFPLPPKESCTKGVATQWSIEGAESTPH